MSSDTVTWRGTRGLIVIQAASLVTGLDFRDEFARKRVLQADTYPDIRFVIDSLAGVHPGDTLEAIAVGKLELHGTTRPWEVPIKAWREPLGLRVTGQLVFPAKDLVTVFNIPLIPLGLGVGAGMWKLIHIGIDAVLVRASSARAGTP